MLRRSARHKGEENANRNSPAIPKAQNAPPRKKAKKAVEPVVESSAIKPQRRRGKLRFITEMPLDILFEIFGHLLPVDILHLSRASKALRDILLRKSAAFVWKQAFSNVPNPVPPPCPDDMNEPQYANLLWGKHCFLCGGSASLAMWPCRLRTCKDCVQTAKFSHLGSVVIQPPSYIFETAKTLCPKWWVRISSGGSSGFVCVTSELENIQKRLDELSEDDLDRLEFITECRQTARARAQHSSLCERWESLLKATLKANRRQELRNVGDSRKNAIFDKMDKLGWSTELSNYNTRITFLALPAVRQKKELTERVWANIEPELVAFLTEVKRQRLERERITVLKARVDILFTAATKDLDAIPIPEVRPSYGDLCVMPEYRAILERPSDAEVTTEDFSDLLTHLSEQTDQWRESNINLLLELLPSSSKGKQRLDTNRLNLCTTFFRCHSCREPISYPRILSHVCLNQRPKPSKTEEEEEEERDLLLSTLQHFPWVHGQKGITFDTEASNITTMLIKLCGQDPKTLTTAAMDELDSRFECVRCVHPSQGRLVMKWRIALLHELEDHYGETLKATSYKLLDPAEVIAAKEREAKVKKRAPPSLLCPRCNKWWDTYTQPQMQDHMKSQHAGESFEPVPHPDVTIRMPPLPVRLKSDVDSL